MAESAPSGTNSFTTTRVFAAPRERVWQEWTEPHRLADWFGGVECEVPLSTVSMDVRPGGAWRATIFCGPDRREIRWTGKYHEVAASERLVFTISDQPGDDRYELVTVVLTDLGDGHRDALRAARAHASRRVRPREAGLGHLLRADRRATGRPRVSTSVSPSSGSRALRTSRESATDLTAGFWIATTMRKSHPAERGLLSERCPRRILASIDRGLALL